MDGNSWLEEINSLYRQYKKNCERAAAQVSDDDFFSSFGQSPHSIAVLMGRRCPQMTPWAWAWCIRRVIHLIVKRGSTLEQSRSRSGSLACIP